LETLNVFDLNHKIIEYYKIKNNNNDNDNSMEVKIMKIRDFIENYYIKEKYYSPENDDDEKGDIDYNSHRSMSLSQMSRKHCTRHFSITEDVAEIDYKNNSSLKENNIHIRRSSLSVSSMS